MNRYSHVGNTNTGSSLNNPSSYSHTSQIDHASSLSRSSTSVGGQHGYLPFDYRPDSDLLANPGIPTPGGSSGFTTSPVPALATVNETEVATHSNNNNIPPVGAAAGPTATTNQPNNSRVLSGISNLSERDRAHLRQISDTSVSSVTTHLGGDRMFYAPEPGQQPDQLQQHHHQIVTSPGPVSPPTAGADGATGEAADYITSRPILQQQQQQQPPLAVTVSPLGDLNPPPPIGGGDGRSSPLRRSVFLESREDMTDDGRPAPPLPGSGPSTSPGGASGRG